MTASENQCIVHTENQWRIMFYMHIRISQMENPVYQWEIDKIIKTYCFKFLVWNVKLYSRPCRIGICKYNFVNGISSSIWTFLHIACTWKNPSLRRVQNVLGSLSTPGIIYHHCPHQIATFFFIFLVDPQVFINSL